MNTQEKEDLLTLKLMVPEIKKSLNKILENQSTISEIKVEVNESKRFRLVFEDKVSDLISQRLNTIQFEQALNEQIQLKTKEYLNRQEVREDFEDKVKDLIETWLSSVEFKKLFKELFKLEYKHIQLLLYFKLTAIVGTVATGLAIAILKGVIGDK